MSDLDGAELSELLQAQQAQPVGAQAKGKKRYTPPKADKNTFDTQEEFIDSLVAIPITSVEEHNRRCAHCWKNYGESDPGAENAENPVKFRCGHVFGETCMREVFKLPTVVKIELRSLSFEPESRGRDLAMGLEMFLDHQINLDKPNDSSIDPGSIPMNDHFVTLLNTIEKPQKLVSASRVLGPWYSLIQQVVYSHHQLLQVHLLENGLVYDVGGPEPVSSFSSIDNYPPHYPPHYIPSFSSYNHPPIFSGPTPSLDDEIKTLIFQDVETKGPGHETALYDILYEHDLQWQSASSSFSTTSKPSKHSTVAAPATNIPSPKPSKSGSSPPKSDSLPVNLPTDVSASNPFHSTHHASETSLPSASISTSAFSALSTVPAVATASSELSTCFPPILSAAAATGHVSEPSTDVPKEHGDSIFAAGQGNDLQVAKSPSKPIAELYSLAWEYLQSKAPHALPLKTLSELTDMAKTALTAKAEENRKKIEAAKKRAAQAEGECCAPVPIHFNPGVRHEDDAGFAKHNFALINSLVERDIRRKAKFEIIAIALAKVVEEYRKYDLKNTQLPAPSPPPLKKLKVELLTKAQPQTHHILHAGATLHEKDLGTAHYNIPQPYDGMGVDHDDDSGAEAGTEGEADSDDPEQHVKDSYRMVVLVRSLCMSCCFPGEARTAALKQFGDPPMSIGWKDVKSAPDCCPLCKKILFKKSRWQGWTRVEV
jgi:hypothetical protein